MKFPRSLGLFAFALALAVTCATSAHAQYAAEPEIVEADETEDMPDGEPMFDEPVDLTMSPSSSPRAFDPSKFLQGLPSPVWTATAGIDNRDATPNSEMRPGHWLPGMIPAQTVGVAWANVTAPGLMMWDRSAIETRVDPYQQTRFGVTLSRSVPVGSDVALTLQNGIAWTQPLLQGAPIVAHGGSGTPCRRRKSRRPLHVRARRYDAVDRRDRFERGGRVAPFAERGAPAARRSCERHRRRERNPDR